MKRTVKIVLGIFLVIILIRLFFFNAEENHVSFPMHLSTPDKVTNFSWKSLLVDVSGDTKYGDADGKELSYHYDAQTDSIWFKYVIFQELESDFPALSLSVDIDHNQENGFGWYGSNAVFRYDKMVSVGPKKIENRSYVGFNGITNQEGIKSRNWVNEKRGNVTYYRLKDNKTFIIGFPLQDLSISSGIINVIGSVGEDAVWNDDIGQDDSYATIHLD